jgi:hypothetical protein
MRKNPDIKDEDSRQEIAGFAQLDLTNWQSNLFRIHVSSFHSGKTFTARHNPQNLHVASQESAALMIP